MVQLKHEELLQKLFGNVNDWLKFAEAKNLGLLTINIAIVFGLSQLKPEEHQTIVHAAFWFFTPLALAGAIASLISLFPILTQIEKRTAIKNIITKITQFIDEEAIFENIHYFGYIKTLELNDFKEKFLAKIVSSDTFTVYEEELALQIIYNSRITSLKFQFFKIGAFLTLLGILIAILSLPILSFLGK